MRTRPRHATRGSEQRWEEMASMKNEAKTISIRLPAEVYRLLREISFYSDRSMNSLICDALDRDDLRARAGVARREYER